jgi:hypothetical protein
MVSTCTDSGQLGCSVVDGTCTDSGQLGCSMVDGSVWTAVSWVVAWYVYGQPSVGL